MKRDIVIRLYISGYTLRDDKKTCELKGESGLLHHPATLKELRGPQSHTKPKDHESPRCSASCSSVNYLEDKIKALEEKVTNFT